MKLRTLGLMGLAGAFCAIAAAEIGLRIVIGERPLFRPHPAIEYENAPDQRVTYRGKRIETNSLGLRSPEISAHKPAGALRVLVIGDSIVFGDLITEQADLATTRLSSQPLPDGRRIEALNIAANSWGPGNMLAWLEAHGDLGADTAILVLSTHDLNDNRSFAALDPRTLPTVRTPSALLTEFSRLLSPPAEITGAPATPPVGDAVLSLPRLLARVSALPSGACLILHEEAGQRALPAHPLGIEALAGQARQQGVAVVFGRDHISAGRYADNIHLTAEGQAGLTSAMRACPALAGVTASVPPRP